jgi:hypothetical protein
MIGGIRLVCWIRIIVYTRESLGVRSPEYSCESQVVAVCQYVVDSLDEGFGVDAITIDSSRAFDLVPHDLLLTKLAAPGVDSRVAVWRREFLVGRT